MMSYYPDQGYPVYDGYGQGYNSHPSQYYPTSHQYPAHSKKSKYLESEGKENKHGCVMFFLGVFFMLMLAGKMGYIIIILAAMGVSIELMVG